MQPLNSRNRCWWIMCAFIPIHSAQRIATQRKSVVANNPHSGLMEIENEPKNFGFLFHIYIDVVNNRIFSVISESICRYSLSRQPLSKRPTENTGEGVVRLFRSGRRRGRVSRQRSTESRAWGVR